MSTSKVGVRTGLRTVERSASATLWLWLLLAVGFLVRLLFMGNEGFRNDVGSFEAWALTLAQHPLSQFYSTTGFADYPPGYFYVLWVIGHFFTWISPHGQNYDVLKYLIKLPAVLMDLFDGVLLYAIVRRFAGDRWALGTAALFILNPATIYISAAWGQVDSIAAGLALLAVYLLLRSDDAPIERATTPIVLAWVALAYSLLIKPQAAVLIPLFIAFAFTNPQRLRVRSIATLGGIVAALLFTLALTLPFHPTVNPVDAFAWLYQKYEFGKDVYAVNTVNAFNLWSVHNQFWQHDSELTGWGIFKAPQYLWGVALLVAAVALVIVRYCQVRTQPALVEAAALLTLAFFMLATRMHERYIYDGLLFTMACVPFALRYLWTSVVFSITLFVNLFYSLTYLSVVTNNTPGPNPWDLWPTVTHPLSILNVAAFFYLGYVYLGQTSAERAAPMTMPWSRIGASPRVQGGRAWFDPSEGLAAMRWPLDYALAGLFGTISFVVSFVNYWRPNEQVFDEIYFARAAQEYLSYKYIYENTHPPLTKLIITLSTMLFGGMAHGNTPWGWRFLDVLFGAIAVVILYAFAKRVTRSTLFASAAALMFTADGMHLVQSRIATPEGIVIVFSLGALYAFYRFWIASQASIRANEPQAELRAGISAAGALVLGCISGLLINAFGNPSRPTPTADWVPLASVVVACVYFAFGWYLVLRLWVVPRFMPAQGEFVSYPDGSILLREENNAQLITPEGAIVKKNVTLNAGAATIAYNRDGSVKYATPAGSATYTPGKVADDAGETEDGRHATTWLIVFTVLLGALVASKWYGVMAYGVSFMVIGAVWLQRFLRPGKPKLWGNPYGFRLDVALAAIVFISMSVYICAWIPDLVRYVKPPGDSGVANVQQLIYRQYTMFEYHDKLVATHPYQSDWWQWPLDLRPIAYYWKDLRTGAQANNSNACCVREITSLPNPLILWFGLLCVPLVGYLAWREKNKGYALLVLAYVLQWLPWAESPRITFAYHFYVDIPIIVLCNVIVLQRIWHWRQSTREGEIFARISVGMYVAAVVLAFIWFYPILTAMPIPWDQWWARMWLHDHWV